MYDAVGDERTRPEHMKLEGVIKKADSAFWDKYSAPLGFNCTASFQNVSGEFTKGFRSFYNGDMVRIYLKSGKVIRGVTLNHPVMTSKGFVLAKNLYKGDKVAKNYSNTKFFSNIGGDIDNDYSDSSARNGFKACVVNAFGVGKSSGFNFYGDIERMNKNVHIAVADRELMRRRSDKLTTFIKKFNFISFQHDRCRF